MIELIQLDYINGAVSHVEQTTNGDMITVDLGTEQYDLHMTGLAYCKCYYSFDCSGVSKGLYENYLGGEGCRIFYFNLQKSKALPGVIHRILPLCNTLHPIFELNYIIFANVTKLSIFE